MYTNVSTEKKLNAIAAFHKAIDAMVNQDIPPILYGVNMGHLHRAAMAVCDAIIGITNSNTYHLIKEACSVKPVNMFYADLVNAVFSGIEFIVENEGVPKPKKTGFTTLMATPLNFAISEVVKVMDKKDDLFDLDAIEPMNIWSGAHPAFNQDPLIFTKVGLAWPRNWVSSIKYGLTADSISHLAHLLGKNDEEKDSEFKTEYISPRGLISATMTEEQAEEWLKIWNDQPNEIYSLPDNSLTFESMSASHIAWANSVFPECTSIGALSHLKCEIEEVIHDIASVAPKEKQTEEFADCWGCLSHAAAMAGITVYEILQAWDKKFQVNKKRKWKYNGDGSYSHVKDEYKREGPFNVKADGSTIPVPNYISKSFLFNNGNPVDTESKGTVAYMLPTLGEPMQGLPLSQEIITALGFGGHSNQNDEVYDIYIANPEKEGFFLMRMIEFGEVEGGAYAGGLVREASPLHYATATFQPLNFLHEVFDEAEKNYPLAMPVLLENLKKYPLLWESMRRYYKYYCQRDINNLSK